jgi:hypothetical protein
MPKKVTREEAMSSAADLRKILASKGPIKSGEMKASGKRSVSKAVEKEVPTGYILIVSTKTRKTKRMPSKAFRQGVRSSGISEASKVKMLAKAAKGDREIYTANTKVLKEFGL